MKKKLLRSFYFALIFFIIRALLAFFWEESITNKFIFESIFIAVLNGLLFGFLSDFLFKKTTMPLIKMFVKFPEVVLTLQEDEEILKEDFGTIKIGKHKAHGKWFLTNKRLIFKYDKANNFDKKLELFLNDILMVESWDTSFFSLYSRGVVIKMKDDREYVLINNDSEVWLLMLQEKINFNKINS